MLLGQFPLTPCMLDGVCYYPAQFTYYLYPIISLLAAASKDLLTQCTLLLLFAFLNLLKFCDQLTWCPFRWTPSLALNFVSVGESVLGPQIPRLEWGGSRSEGRRGLGLRWRALSFEVRCFTLEEISPSPPVAVGVYLLLLSAAWCVRYDRENFWFVAGMLLLEDIYFQVLIMMSDQRKHLILLQMYKNSYQLGKVIPLLNIQNKDTLKQWSFNGPVKKAYDKSCKGFIMLFDHSTKAQLPADLRQDELYLVQPFLLLQVMIMDKKQFHLEVVVTDQTKTKRRLVFSPGTGYSQAKDNIARQPLHGRIPADLIREGVWLNLQIDIYSFIECCFGNPQHYFRSIDAIQLSGPCRLRKVLTMKGQLVDHTPAWLEKDFGQDIAQEFEETFGNYPHQQQQQSEDLPPNLNFTPGVDYLNQLISYDRVKYWGYLQDLVANGGHTAAERKKSKNIAFGRRVTQKPVLEGRQQMEQVLGSAKGGQGSPQRGLVGAAREGVIRRREGSADRSQISQHLAHNINIRQNVSGEFDLSSPNRFHSPGSILPRSMAHANDDFSQYRGTSIKNLSGGKQQSPGSRRVHPPPMVQDNGDQYLNERLRQLEAQRPLINQLANKYNLDNSTKLDRLSLLTLYHNGKAIHPDHQGVHIQAVDPKERIREYHSQVNSKRREIHQKQKKKHRVWQHPVIEPEEEASAEVGKGEETGENTEKVEERAVEEGASQRKQRSAAEMKQGEEVEGWEGEENDKEEEYGEEEGAEEKAAAEDGEQADEDYGKEEDGEAKDEEEDYGGEEEAGDEGAAEDYGDEDY